jgi:hypothetical protein
MGVLLSGETSTLQEWDVIDILDLKKKSYIKGSDRLTEYEWDNTIGPYCEGFTYLELEQLNNLTK